VPQFTVDEKGTLQEPPEVAAQNGRMEDELKALLSSRLAKTPNHDVYIFVHGYNNTFEEAAFVMAELWHFMGRSGVPIIYTWPAGSSEGALGCYESDRESGQFTSYHLKQFLKTVASCPDVDKIHLVAHSRGADILMTALLELHIACSAAGKDTRSRLKLGNVVLAAADLDLDVTSQRFATERLLFAPERITVYMSQSDRAIGLVDMLYASVRRIGRLRSSDLKPQGLDALKDMRQLQFIDVRVKTDFIGHVYFHSSPAVSSDLILLLRDSCGPGAENGRPLIKREDGFWEIRDNYLRGPGR
jgi:esterase/lipase superfamily enzyme